MPKSEENRRPTATILRIYTIARPSINWSTVGGLGEFLADQGIEWKSSSDVPAEQLVEFAGRLCYNSYTKPRPGGNVAYIDNILKHKHGAVIEHANWTFLFTGVSRSLTHELVRHRVGFSYSQRSQRYVDESESAVVVPAIIAECPEAQADFMDAMDYAQESYRDIMETLERKVTDTIRAKMPEGLSKVQALTDVRKVVRGAARSVLPNAVETQIVVTANARAWRHFCALRGAYGVDYEIRQCACDLARILKGDALNLFQDFTIEPHMEDGRDTVQVIHEKV